MAVPTIALDFGASGTRAVMSLSEAFKLILHLMPCEIIKTTRESARKHNQSILGTSDPFYSGWVEINKECYCFGLAAKNHKADLQLEKSKFELAIPKVMAMLGAIAQTYKLPRKTSFNLAVLLPASEYSDRHIFEPSLKAALADFKFLGIEMSFVLKSFECLPEGGGVLLKGRRPGSSLRGRNVTVIMQGFRDVSLLPVVQGSLSPGISKNIGFHDLCLSVGQQIAYHDYQMIAKVICQSSNWFPDKDLQPLLGNMNPSYRNRKVAQIRQAIKSGRKQYLLNLSQWLKANLGNDLDEIIVAGGSAYYFRKDLQKLFKQLGVPEVLWCDELEERIRSSFGSQIEQHSLHYRLADVYSLFFYLHGKTTQK